MPVLAQRSEVRTPDEKASRPGVVEGSEVVGELVGPELELVVSAELGMRMTRNHLRNLLFVDRRDLVSIARGPFGAHHLPPLVEFETMDQLDTQCSSLPWG